MPPHNSKEWRPRIMSGVRRGDPLEFGEKGAQLDGREEAGKEDQKGERPKKPKGCGRYRNLIKVFEFLTEIQIIRVQSDCILTSLQASFILKRLAHFPQGPGNRSN